MTEEMIDAIRTINLVWSLANFWWIVYLGVRNWVPYPSSHVWFGLACLAWTFDGAYHTAEDLYFNVDVGFRSLSLFVANAVTSYAAYKTSNILMEKLDNDAEL